MMGVPARPLDDRFTFVNLRVRSLP